MSFFDQIHGSYLINLYNSPEPPLALEVRKICADLIEAALIERNPQTNLWSLKHIWDWALQAHGGWEDFNLASTFINQLKNELENYINNNPTKPELETFHQHVFLIQLDEARLVDFVREICMMVQNEINWLNDNRTTSSSPLQKLQPLESSLSVQNYNVNRSSNISISKPVVTLQPLQAQALSNKSFNPEQQQFSQSQVQSPLLSHSSVSTSSPTQPYLWNPGMAKPNWATSSEPTVDSKVKSIHHAFDLTNPTSSPESTRNTPSEVLSNLNYTARSLEAMSFRIADQVLACISTSNEYGSRNKYTTRAVTKHTDDDVSKKHLCQIDSLTQNISKSNKMIADVVECLTTVVKPLWNYQNQCEAVGIPQNEPRLNLQELYRPCEQICNSFYRISKRILPLENISHYKNLSNFVTLIAASKQSPTFFKLFLQATFLVKNQPPLAVSPVSFIINTNFYPPSVTLLCGTNRDFLNSQVLLVEISLINNKYTKVLFEKGLESMYEIIENDCVGPLRPFSNETAMFTNNLRQGNCPEATFDRLELLKGRPDCTTGSGNSNLSGEKCRMLFTFEINVLEESFKIWTTSLPFYATYNHYANVRGWGMAEMIRDYLKSPMTPTCVEISHPDTITWNKLHQIIGIMFKKYVGNEGMQLNEVQWKCIKNKVKYSICKRSHEASKFSFEEINWNRLIYSPSFSHAISGETFSFWDWLVCSFETLRLKNMAKMWKEDLIMGFIDRETATSKLSIESGTAIGTFLLRFSDSVPGAISIVVLKPDNKVHSLTPFKMEEIRARSLANLIKEKELTHSLKYLYGFGTVKKDDIFRKYEKSLIVPGYE